MHLPSTTYAETVAPPRCHWHRCHDQLTTNVCLLFPGLSILSQWLKLFQLYHLIVFFEFRSCDAPALFLLLITALDIWDTFWFFMNYMNSKFFSYSYDAGHLNFYKDFFWFTDHFGEYYYIYVYIHMYICIYIHTHVYIITVFYKKYWIMVADVTQL